MISTYNKASIIATDRVPNGITMNAAYYQKFIRSALRPQIQKFWPKKLTVVFQYSIIMRARMLRTSSQFIH